jgi:DNA processing protein
MPLSLILQLIFYDRPRRLKAIWSKVKTESDVGDIIKDWPKKDAFRSEAIQRFNMRHAMSEKMQKYHIHWVGMENEQYPVQFHQLYDPPVGIFYKGQLMVNRIKCCAIVGSRKASLMASYRVASLMKVISNYCIISGGALGVDAMAHQEALNCQLPTAAVLASGLDYLYPQTNRAIFDRLLLSGNSCIISECPPGVRPKPYFFPQRNRLIAALCSKLIVVEAAMQSGALLTANGALGLSADVAAMVGSYNSPHSEGCYALMNDGAFVIGSDKDACQFLGLKSVSRERKASSNNAQLADFLDAIPMDPIHIDDLAYRTSLALDKIIEYVTFLSLNGDVIVSAGQMVCRRV